MPDIYNIQPPTMSLLFVPIARMSPARAPLGLDRVQRRLYGYRSLQAGWLALPAYPRLYAFALWGWLVRALLRYEADARQSSRRLEDHPVST